MYRVEQKLLELVEQKLNIKFFQINQKNQKNQKINHIFDLNIKICLVQMNLVDQMEAVMN